MMRVVQWQCCCRDGAWIWGVASGCVGCPVRLYVGASSEDWLIACSAETGDLRLASGMASEDGNAEFGRLEIFNDGGWGTVCDRTGSGFGQNRFLGDFTEASVDVACKQLGFAEGVKTQVSVCLFLFRCIVASPCWAWGQPH